MSDQAATPLPESGGTAPLAEFTLDLAKAMLRTGYYAPDHPEARQSLEGLHDHLRRAAGDDSGLTYMVGRKGDAETVMVQGHGDGPETLDHIMPRGMAELFAPKLLDFFHRRRLVSFSLRARVAPDELSAFVTLMSEPPKAGRVEEERERVEAAFLERHIINVSTVFESDILGRARKLPWRVELALSRLGRDLRMLPLFENASDEEVRQVKLQILDDLIRPLQAPALVKDFLLNCDLLAEDVAELGDAQIEREIIAQVPLGRLEATCRVILEEMQGGAGDELQDRRRLILRHVLLGLLAAEARPPAELVDACVRQGAATFEELPRATRARIRRRRAIDTFLVREEEYLRALSHIPGGPKGVEVARTAEALFTELMKRELYGHAAQILEAVRSGRHAEEGAELARGVVDHLRELLSDPDTVRPVVRRLEDPDRALAEALVPLAVLAGEAAVDELRALYAESESRLVRAHAFDAIKGIGAPALVPFLEHLAETEDEWPAIHHILTALAGVDDPRVVEALHPFLGHANGHVRQAALARAFEMEGAAAEDRLIRALRDEDPSVRHTAVAYLAELGSRHPAFSTFVTSALHPGPDDARVEESDEVLVEICRSLVTLAEAHPERRQEFEELLLEALALADRAKVLGRLRKAHAHFDARVRAAVCEALGALGTERSLEALEEVSEEDGPAGAAAGKAAAEIRGR